MYLILVGGGNVGLQLARRLQQRDHEVLLLEKDPSQAQRLAASLGDDSVFLGDGCETSVQKAAGFGRADVVVAVTGEDEDNLVVCQMAKVMWKVGRVLARVNDPSHEEIFRQIGIDDTVSATGIIFNLLEQQISTDQVIPLGTLAKGNIELVETVLSGRSPVVGKRVRELSLPPRANIIWINRGGQGILVNGDSELVEGDEVVAVVPTDEAEDLRQMLVPVRF
ncbi:MAG: TrkA family potassium uptake protein [Chthonomonas sp.]|nr:TrkA family potassium uptake protein [Chthonomonas sp.]